MSVDITDKNLIKLVREQGIKYIVDFLYNSDIKSEEVKVSEVDNGETILIQTPSYSTTDNKTYIRSDSWSNTVGISNNRMYINPCFKKFPLTGSIWDRENSMMMELKEHIEMIPQFIRDEKLKNILNEN